MHGTSAERTAPVNAVPIKQSLRGGRKGRGETGMRRSEIFVQLISTGQL